MPRPTIHPKPAAGLVDRVVGGERVLLDSARGLIHRLNSTASLVWDRCDGATSVDAICAEIALQFGGASETIAADIEALLRQLTELGLLDTQSPEA